MKYFFGENAHRPFRLGGKTYTLEVVSVMGGTAQGVLAVADESEAAALISGGGKFVREIPKVEYDQLVAKKKRTSSSSSSAHNQPPRAPSGVSSIKVGARGAGVAGLPSASVPPDTLPVSVDEVVRIERIAADAPSTGSDNRPPLPSAARGRGGKAGKRTAATAETVADPAKAEPAIAPEGGEEPAL